MQPVVISASTRDWIDCKEHPYPQDTAGYAFLAVLEDDIGVRRRELVVNTEYGLLRSWDWAGEEYDPDELICDDVTHWMPQDIPKHWPKKT